MASWGDALERLSAGATFFRSALSAGAESRLRAQCRTGEGICRELGLPIDRNRLARPGRAQRYRPDRYCQPQRHPRRDRHCRGQGGEDGPLRKAAGTDGRGGQSDGRCRRGGQCPEHGLVQLPACSGCRAAKELARRRPLRPHLSLPLAVLAGLDHLAGPAAGRRRPVAAG